MEKVAPPFRRAQTQVLYLHFWWASIRKTGFAKNGKILLKRYQKDFSFDNDLTNRGKRTPCFGFFSNNSYRFWSLWYPKSDLI